MLGHWKDRAVRAEDRCMRLENEIELLKAAAKVTSKPKSAVKSAAKAVVKGLSGKASGKPATA
jgi:hypothetical protein